MTMLERDLRSYKESLDRDWSARCDAGHSRGDRCRQMEWEMSYDESIGSNGGPCTYATPPFPGNAAHATRSRLYSLLEGLAASRSSAGEGQLPMGAAAQAAPPAAASWSLTGAARAAAEEDESNWDDVSPADDDGDDSCPNSGELRRDVSLVKALLGSELEAVEGFEQWRLDARQLSVGDPIARGTFGRVYRGTYRGEDVAIKLLENTNKEPRKVALLEQQFAQEVAMLAELQHPQVVAFRGAAMCRSQPPCYAIVTQFCPGGSLRHYLNQRRQKGPMPLGLVVRMALQVAQGMAFLHSRGVIHRDLKSDNLLVTARQRVHIADFGVARIQGSADGMTPETGTYRWMAPEMVRHSPYSHKVDVYSFGIVLWELLTGEVPFHTMTAVQAAMAVAAQNLRPAIPGGCPPLLERVMRACWDPRPERRPEFARIAGWLQGPEAVALVAATAGRARLRHMFCLSPSPTLP